MAVASDRRAGCDGCGRSVPIEDLAAVSMPDGDQVVCCPRCEPHAREAARKSASLDQRRGTCDGCRTTVLETELEEIVVDDGTVLSCCPSCLAEVPDRKTASDESKSRSGRFATSDDARSERPSSSGETVCTQCNEWVSGEPFRVTTVDDRTERLCPSCKEAAEEDGIVKDVRMRKTEAREVLGVTEGVTEQHLRQAYRRQIKRAHPDRTSGSRAAFQLVTEAYERLREG